MPTSTFLNLEINKQERIISAALDEFSKKPYEQVMISDIIKSAQIPRGSFYQYFNDKEDLYLYIINSIRDKKMKFIQETEHNYQEMNFLELVDKLYESGVRFALMYHKHVKVLDFLLKNKNPIFYKLMADNLKIAEDYYASLIEKDKSRGLLKEDIDTSVFAKIIVQLTSNIAIEEMDLSDAETSYQRMLERNRQILKIIEHGVLKG